MKWWSNALVRAAPGQPKVWIKNPHSPAAARLKDGTF
jgi:hypothetical protein